MPFLELTDGGRLHYEIEGTGPPLLLVPCLGGLASFWHPHVEPLARHFTVVLHDHRGTGRSGAQRIDYSVEQMADDVLQLMDHLALERAHLVGHSTGGAIGQILALDRPERVERLVLSATWAGHDPYFQLLFDMRADVLRRLGPAAYLRTSALFLMPPFWVTLHAAELEVDEAEALRRMPDPEVVLRRIAAIQRFDRRTDVHRIAAPTLVIGARDDAVTPAYLSEELGRLIPSATTMMPRGGHFFPQIEAEAFRSAALDFLSGA